MDVNTTKSSAAADHIAAAAKVKKSEQTSEGVASFFASIVSAATTSSAQTSGMGALGGLFAKNEATRETSPDDLGDTDAHADRDWNTVETPDARHYDDPVRPHDKIQDYQDAPPDASVVSAPQHYGEQERTVPTEQPAQHTDAAPTSDASQNHSAKAAHEDGSDTPQTHASVKGTQAATAAGTNGAELPVIGTQGANEQAHIAAGSQQGAVKPEAVKAPSVPEAVVKEAAATAGQAQAKQPSVATDSEKKPPAQTKTTQQNTAVKANIDDTGAPQHDAVKTKTTGKSSQVQTATTHQTDAQAKGDVKTGVQGTERAQQVQTQTQAQAQAQDLSRRLAGNQRVDVAVTVEKEAESLTSRPTASLSATAAKAAASAATGRDNDVGQNGQNAGGNAQGQAQARAQAQMAMQNQAAAQAASRPAAAGGFQAQASAATTTQVGSIEGASATTAATGTAPSAATQQANVAAPQQTPKTPTSHQAQRTATEQVSVQIAKAAGDGTDKISIRLNPASLGRIEVQLEMTQDGRMTANIMADNKDTFDMLQKDSRELAKALQEAGFDTKNSDLNFGLRGDNAANQGQRDHATSTRTAQPNLDLIEQPLDDLLAGEVNRNIITQDRINIQV